jgi:hypothetical protein
LSRRLKVWKAATKDQLVLEFNSGVGVSETTVREEIARMKTLRDPELRIGRATTVGLSESGQIRITIFRPNDVPGRTNHRRYRAWVQHNVDLIFEMNDQLRVEEQERREQSGGRALRLVHGGRVA